ncbi:3-deoxy-D-manno-octulosonic acid transferase [Tateyamaria sp.]|uniref:3-deoxy-D-manno-octulosonic acid transferase n=1 Tax=Tateyamaria sp. TaxID=1929288 RepID=UPI00329DB0FF
MRPTALFHLYKGLSTFALPFTARHGINKLRAAGISIDRAHQRLGHATAERRAGSLIWFHAADVDQVKSVQALITHITTQALDTKVLLTSSTAASAQGIARDLPQGAVHQFSPFEGPGPMKRFLQHWRPDLCVLVSSDLWPNLLDTCASAGIPIALLDAGLSDSDAQGWKRFPDTTDYVLRGIRMAHCQDIRSRNHLRDMGLAMAQHGAKLNTAKVPTHVDPVARDATFNALKGRPIWVASSTHAGEEEQVLSAHARLLLDHPNLCLILAPHDPERGNAVATVIQNAGLSVARSSTGGTLGDGAQVFLADTKGQTDLWYALSPIVFLAGTFANVGGHAPFGAANGHTAILHGPNYAKFGETYAAFQLQDASIEVKDSEALAAEIHDLLTHPSRAAQLAARARPFAQNGIDLLARLSDQLLSLADTETNERPPQ